VSASKFTPEVRGALIERTGLGLSLADACRSVGVREATVKGWLTRGRREGSGDYAEFVAAIERAREAARERPDPMDADELARVVSEMARKGSVQAAKLRWDMLTAAEGPDKEPATSATPTALRGGSGDNRPASYSTVSVPVIPCSAWSPIVQTIS
jgi:transposase